MSKTIYYNQLTKKRQKEILYELIKHSFYSEYNDDLQQFTDIIMPNGNILKFRFYHDLLPSLYYLPELLYNMYYKNETAEIFNVDFSKLPLDEENIGDLIHTDLIDARIIPVSYPKTREESLELIEKWFPKDKLYTRLETEYKDYYNLDEDSLEFKYFIAEHRAGLSILQKNILFKYKEIKRKIFLDDKTIILDNSFTNDNLFMKERVRYNVDMDFTINLNKQEVKILREVMKLLLPIKIEKVTDDMYKKIFTKEPIKKDKEQAKYIHMLGDEIYNYYNKSYDNDFDIEESYDDAKLFNSENYDNDEESNIEFEIDFESVTPIIFKPMEEQDIDFNSLNLDEDNNKYVDEE